jgi:hypothetical protein
MQSDKIAPLGTSAPLLMITIEGENVKTAHYTEAARIISSFGLSHHVGVIVPERAAHRDAFAGALASVRPICLRPACSTVTRSCVQHRDSVLCAAP